MKIASAQTMKEMDRCAIDELGVSSLMLMENAAHAVAEQVCALAAPQDGGIVVFAGTGNNGGDGAACARFLLERGYHVRCFLCGPREKMTPDLLQMERRLIAAGGRLEQFTRPEAEFALHSASVVVDALFGTGLNKPLQGESLLAVQMINHSVAKVVACDIASGVSADTGEILGDAVFADVTVTFSMAKPGQLLSPGLRCTGQLVVAEIGIPQEAMENRTLLGELITPNDVRPLFPARQPDAHKGNFGKLLLLCGSIGYTGAAAMAAQAALRAGAGLIYLGVPQSIYPILAAKLDEVMVFPLPDDEAGRLSAQALPKILQHLAGMSACLMGPGLGRSSQVRELVRGVLQENSSVPVVLDADGINALEGHIDVLRGATCPVVLTPHDGEFARIGGNLAGSNRLDAASTLAAELGAVVVLKGHRTIVTDGKARFVNTTGNPGMAVGGSGDVLAGMMVSFMGQGLPTLDAARAAVCLHGAAGDLCAQEIGEYGMTPTDLIRTIPRLLP
jgi:hydroxyethylthiazole kinase-like uncharacterized protein yjeF